ncbi:VOC family protein [Aquabacter sp. CN5-332]|uniref:VOC family protein n=1 Tax=Aquabacter sp. CN5-332 TaxID=3156608 RepID=UPI0032B41A8F
MSTTQGFVFDHIHIFTSDLEATVHWFREALGAEIITSPLRTQAKIGALAVFFEDVSNKSGINPAAATPHRGADHFAFAVKDIDNVVADLKAKGIVFTKEPHSPRPGIRLCFIQGPDGISVELLERDPKYS